MAGATSFLIGVAILGLAYEFLFRRDGLRNDRSVEGWAMKMTLLCVGLYLTIYPLSLLWVGEAEQRLAMKAMRQEIQLATRDAKEMITSPGRALLA